MNGTIPDQNPVNNRRPPNLSKLRESESRQTDLSLLQRREDIRKGKRPVCVFRPNSDETPPTAKSLSSSTDGSPCRRSTTPLKKVREHRSSQKNRAPKGPEIEGAGHPPNRKSQISAPNEDTIEQARLKALEMVARLLNNSGDRDRNKVNGRPYSGGLSPQIRRLPKLTSSSANDLLQADLLLPQKREENRLKKESLDDSPEDGEPPAISKSNTTTIKKTDNGRFIDAENRPAFSSIGKNTQILVSTFVGQSPAASETVELARQSASKLVAALDGNEDSKEEMNPDLMDVCTPTTIEPTPGKGNIYTQKVNSDQVTVIASQKREDSTLYTEEIHKNNSSLLHVAPQLTAGVTALSSDVFQSCYTGDSSHIVKNRTTYNRKELLDMHIQSSSPKKLQLACAKITLHFGFTHSKKIAGKVLLHSPDFVPYLNRRTNQVRYIKRSPVLSIMQNKDFASDSKKSASDKIYCENGRIFKCILSAERDKVTKQSQIEETVYPVMEPIVDPKPATHVSLINQHKPKSFLTRTLSRKRIFAQYASDSILDSEQVQFKPSLGPPDPLSPICSLKEGVVARSPPPPLNIPKKRSRSWFRHRQLGQFKHHFSNLVTICRERTHKHLGNSIAQVKSSILPGKRRYGMAGDSYGV